MPLGLQEAKLGSSPNWCVHADRVEEEHEVTMNFTDKLLGINTTLPYWSSSPELTKWRDDHITEDTDIIYISRDETFALNIFDLWICIHKSHIIHPVYSASYFHRGRKHSVITLLSTTLKRNRMSLQNERLEVLCIIGQTNRN